MKCYGCGATKTAAERLGHFWCGHCLGNLQFEERLAAANGLCIVDVFLRDGRVGYAFAHQPNRAFSRAELRQIGITRGDVLLEITSAARAFRQSLVLVGDRVAAMNRDALCRAREFIEIASKHEPLLAEDERRDIASVLAVAHAIAGSVH
jgi:hypothetical protein